MTKYLTPAQVAEDEDYPFGNADWVRAQLRTGALRGVKVGGRWMTTKEWVEDMLLAGGNQPAGPSRGYRRRRRRDIR
ncbi:hypothetical protein ACLM5J_09650 [Nocardioides sp. Bht2]|uniref:hypothetical protein n=1 Tax=Nocardioides sp. Bht2 TaxID=3392297 RepID=UPI0039B5961F